MSRTITCDCCGETRWDSEDECPNCLDCARCGEMFVPDDQTQAIEKYTRALVCPTCVEKYGDYVY